MINVFVKKEDVKGAYAVLDQMQAQGVRPNEVTYNSLINLFVKKEDVQGAYDLFEQMQAQGVRPDEVTFNILIDLLVKCDQIEEATKLFTSSRSLQKHMLEPHVLDLHQLSHGAAFIALGMFLDIERTSVRFTLIPGKGGQMSNFIQEKIRNKLPTLSCEVDPKNAGRLIIQRKRNSFASLSIEEPK